MATSTVNTNKPIIPRGADVRPIDSYNRAALYSGKVLDFDGVNDLLTMPTALTSSLSTTTITHVLNFKTDFSSFASSRDEVFSYSERGIIFTFNFGNIVVYYRHSGGSWGAITIPTDKIKLQEWNHCAIVIDYNNDLGKVYINGHEVASISSLAGANIAYDSNALTIGGQAGSRFFDGQIAGFKIFNTALTSTQVSDLYNNPEKIVPTGVDNTALKLWLPMMEGAGTTAINGAPDALGSELVTNGTFDSADDWSHSSQYSISSGKASYNGSGSGKLYQTGKNLVGTKNYILTFDVSNASTYANIWIGNQAGLNSYTASATYQTYYNGTNAVLLEGANIGPETTLAFYANNVGSSFDIDNISLKEVVNCGTISGATWTHGIGAPVSQTSVIDWNKWKLEGGSTSNEYLIPQGLTSGRDLLGNLFENVRKQGALNLDGNSWAEVHDNASLDITDAITLEAWVYWDDSLNKGIIGKWDYSASKASYLLYKLSATNFRFYVSNNGTSVYITTNGTNISNGWNHLIGVYDGANIKCYLNGSADGSTSYALGIFQSDVNLEIGKSTSEILPNQIAQPRIYNRALTAEEVLKNYNATKTQFE